MIRELPYSCWTKVHTVLLSVYIRTQYNNGAANKHDVLDSHICLFMCHLLPGVHGPASQSLYHTPYETHAMRHYCLLFFLLQEKFTGCYVITGSTVVSPSFCPLELNYIFIVHADFFRGVTFINKVSPSFY